MTSRAAHTSDFRTQPSDPSSAPQNFESLALQSAPAIGKGIISQSGIWGLMFVLLVMAQMAFFYFVVPSHLDKINAGHKEAWEACKTALSAERADNKINLEAQRQENARNVEALGKSLEALGQRMERGFDRIRDGKDRTAVERSRMDAQTAFEDAGL